MQNVWNKLFKDLSRAFFLISAKPESDWNLSVRSGELVSQDKDTFSDQDLEVREHLEEPVFILHLYSLEPRMTPGTNQLFCLQSEVRSTYSTTIWSLGRHAWKQPAVCLQSEVPHYILLLSGVPHYNLWSVITLHSTCR